MRSKHLVAILVLLMLAVPASPAHAAGVVTVCDEAHLRAALAGGGTVTFTCSGVITLTTEIVIATDTTIDGSGQAVTISGNNSVRVFTVNSGITLDLIGLTVANGYADEGGGINNTEGTLIVSDSTFSGNSADYGGGIGNGEHGTVTVNNSTFSGNTARLQGGGLFNWAGAVNVSDSTFSGNSTAYYGGGISNGYPGSLTVSNSTFSSNSAGNYAGGIFNSGPATMTNSTFFGNTAGYGGGGIYNKDGTLTVSNSMFSGNSAGWNGGGIDSDNGGTVTVRSSTFSSNRTAHIGGGIYNYGTLTVTNSTFSGNSAPSGGGMYNYYGNVKVTSSTFFDNSAPSGGSIYNYWSTVTLKNTLVANSPTGGNCSGSIVDGGGNLSYPDSTCPGINADPMLGPLQNNGGPTETMTLLPGSAAIDTGDDAICAAEPVNNLDQRGVTRPQGPHCDIGAVERQVFGLWFPFARAQ